MAIKSYKPTTPGRRGMTVTDYSGLSKAAPCKSLLEPMDKHSGRNSYGRITVRHRGGGGRRRNTGQEAVDPQKDSQDRNSRRSGNAGQETVDPQEDGLKGGK